MDIQRLRNLTTGRLHTDIGCIYEDLELISGASGLMTHMLPRMLIAIEVWLRTHVNDARFWDGEYDPSHTGDFALPEPTHEDRDLMVKRYKSQPDPLTGKKVIAVHP